MASICKLCKTDYKYPSKLKKHRNSLYGCKYKDSDYIQILNISNISTVPIIPIIPTISNISNIPNILSILTNNTLNCNQCKKIFKFKSSLTRHIKQEICIKTTTNNITINNNTHTINNTSNTNNTPNDIIYPINNQLINIIVEKTKKIEALIEENTLLIQNNIEGKKDESNTNTLLLNNISINSRKGDMYINAIQLCKAGDKLFNDWYSLDSTKKLITDLKKEITNDTINEELILIDCIEHNSIDSISISEEIWIHPMVALELALFISTNFMLQINKWIYKLLNNSILETKINILKSKDITIKSKEERIKLLEDTYLKKHDRIKYNGKNIIYMITNDYNKSNRNYIIGKAIDLTNRLTSYNKSTEHEVIYYKSCKDEATMHIVETMVLNKLDMYKEVANRDRFILPIEKEISFFTNVIDESVNFFN